MWFLLAIFTAGILRPDAQAVDQWREVEEDMYGAVVASLHQLQERLRTEDAMRAAGWMTSFLGNDHACYPVIGCFYKNGTFSHIRTLPDPPEFVNTALFLYTPRNKYHEDILKYADPASVANSHYDPTLPLKIVIHGFGGKKNVTWMWELKDAFLDRFNFNVILVEWSDGAKIPYYINAAANTELVGRQVAALILMMKEHFGLREENVHIIGFSLGGQAAGFVGERMLELEGVKPGKITALDPAGPLFEDHGEDVHVSDRDADFVEVIHTNADNLLYGGVGTHRPLGHVDFYPNGGKRQPGCPSTISGAFEELFTKNQKMKCNHRRAFWLYLESVRNTGPCQFVAFHCADGSEGLRQGRCSLCSEAECGRMGHDSEGRGSLYLVTHDTSPYCSQNFRVTVKFPEDMTKSYGKIVLTILGDHGEETNFTVTGHDQKLTADTATMAIVNGTNPLTAVRGASLTYHKYRGWFTSGTDTLHVDSVVVEDMHGKLMFASCNKALEIKDNERTELVPSPRLCE